METSHNSPAVLSLFSLFPAFSAAERAFEGHVRPIRDGEQESVCPMNERKNLL